MASSQTVTATSQKIPGSILRIFQSATGSKESDAVEVSGWLKELTTGDPATRDAQVESLIEAIPDPSVAQRARALYYDGYAELGISNDDLGKPVLDFIMSNRNRPISEDIIGVLYGLAQELQLKEIFTLRDLLEAPLRSFKDRETYGKGFILQKALEAINKAYGLTVHEKYTGLNPYSIVQRLVKTTEPLTLKSVLVKGQLPTNY